MRKTQILLLSVLLLLFCSNFEALAQKTDKLLLKNGDVITGEVKKLDLDILQYKTSSMSTAKIKWFHVNTIISPGKKFQVELRDGTKIVGALDTAKIPNTLKIVGHNGEFNISIGQVVTITQLKKVFWNKFSGNLSVGINYTKASSVFQTNYGGALSFTEENYFSKIEFNSLQTTQQDSIYTAKQDMALNVARAIRKKEFAIVFGGVQKNTELGIDNRSSAGLGYGMDFLHVSVARLRGYAGITGNREQASGDNPSTNNLEGIVNGGAMVFKYTDPEIHLNAFVNWYPSFTVAGRHRFEAELQVKLELVNDLFIELRVYTNNDNKPASQTASTNDYGVISSLSYKFGL